MRKFNGLNRMGPDAKPNGAGRPVGSKDKIGLDLKKAILEAAAELGRDGQGAEGLVGYLKMLGAQLPADVCVAAAPHDPAANER